MTMVRSANPYTVTFRDLLAWGWESRGHCRTCDAVYPADIARMAALPTGDRAIALRFERGRYACRVCGAILSGITILGKLRRDGLRQVIEMGECPPVEQSADTASVQKLLFGAGRSSRPCPRT
jgi:hypothetical protein